MLGTFYNIAFFFSPLKSEKKNLVFKNFFNKKKIFSLFIIMETVKTESPHTHLPNNTLLMPIQSMQPGDDTVMMEVEESSIYNRKGKPK